MKVEREISEQLNISMPMFSYYCRKEAFSGRFREKLISIGIVVFEEEKQTEFTEEYINELREEVSH